MPECNTSPVQRRHLPLYEPRDFPRPAIPDELSTPFNVIIAICQPNTNDFRLFYSPGMGMGLKMVPDTIKLNGLEQLFAQLLQMDASELAQVGLADNPHLLRTIKIDSKHIKCDSHCAVCKDPFELGSEAIETPCKHLYHEDCISPWISVNNSCPVCRHQMSINGAIRGRPMTGNGLAELTIWRLPGGGFSVGRFAGPVLYTDSEGTLTRKIVSPREVRISPREVSRSTRSRRRNEFSKFMQKIFSCFGPCSSNFN